MGWRGDLKRKRKAGKVMIKIGTKIPAASSQQGTVLKINLEVAVKEISS